MLEQIPCLRTFCVLMVAILAVQEAAASGRKFQLHGATGSGPFDVAQSWTTAFSALYPEVEITLTSVGSGAAQQALWGDIDCESNPVVAVCALRENKDDPVGSTLWGIGEAPFPSGLDSPLQLQQFPVCAGAVLLVHGNEIIKSGNAPLRLTFDVLGGIFNDTIEEWNHPLIAEINPGVILADEHISIVVRSDSSGQSSVFSSALGNKVPGWSQDAVGTLPNWPFDDLVPSTEATSTCEPIHDLNGTIIGVTTVSQHHIKAEGQGGVSNALLRTPYSIGYVELGQFNVLSDFLGQAHLSSPAYPTSFVSASAESVSVTEGGLAGALDPQTLRVDLSTETTPEGGYPIAGYAYWYVKLSPEEYSSCYEAWLVCKMVEWAYTNSQAADLALEQGWVTPPDSVVELALARLWEVKCFDEDTGEPVPVLSYTPPPYVPELNQIDDFRPVAWAFGGIVVLTSLAFMCWVIWNREVRIVRSSQPSFLVIICIGTIVMGSAIFPLGIDDSLVSTRGCDVACMSWIWLFPCGFTISFSALFSKIWRLNQLIEHSQKFRKLKVEVKDVLIPFAVMFTLNVALLLAWTLTDPWKWKRIYVDELNSYGTCKADGNSWVIYLSLITGINACALILANWQAYKARNINMEFNESKFVTLAMASMLQVLLIALPLTFLVTDNPSARLFVLSGIIFVISMSLLILIFVPKMMFRTKKDKKAFGKSALIGGSSGIECLDSATGDNRSRTLISGLERPVIISDPEKNNTTGNTVISALEQNNVERPTLGVPQQTAADSHLASVSLEMADIPEHIEDDAEGNAGKNGLQSGASPISDNLAWAQLFDASSTSAEHNKEEWMTNPTLISAREKKRALEEKLSKFPTISAH